MIFYSPEDRALIAASYQAARLNLGANTDRRNIDAVWNSGLSGAETAPLAFNPTSGVWSPACNGPDGTTDRGLCDPDTRLITISGVWDRTVAPYAVAGQPITKAGFVALWHRVADADPDPSRRSYMHTIADDIAATAKEPAP